MIALLAPGQGSQAPGMLSPWLELDGARDRIEAWSEATSLDLVRLGTEADADEIRDTAITQPLIVALSLLALEELRRRVDLPSGVPVAGHSVGELAAAAAAGVLSPEAAVELAAVRGREMAGACALEPTGMSAVLGGDRDEVLSALAELSLDAANHNATGQIVAAGRISALQELASEPPSGARVRPLAVAGAFHTRYMAPAEEALRLRVESLPVSDPVNPLLSNSDGRPVESGADMMSRLVAQVTRPVDWYSCMATLVDLGVTAVVELPPAGTLAGLVKREHKLPTLPLKTPDHLDRVAAFIHDHHTDPSGGNA
nr:ACP S-malonyltransferase [Actinoalloteichus spitiensis]